MTEQRRVHQRAKDFFRWLTDQHHSNYGENDYIVLRGMGDPRYPGFHYVFREHIVVAGGTGQHQNALRRVVGEDQQVGKRALLGIEHWLVIGPAHDGQRRALPFTTSTVTNCEIKASDGYVHNAVNATTTT
jgi:hypothetical protein